MSPDHHDHHQEEDHCSVGLVNRATTAAADYNINVEDHAARVKTLQVISGGEKIDSFITRDHHQNFLLSFFA